MNPDSPYARKFRRAMKHLEEVESYLGSFEDSHPCVPVRDRETNPNPRVWAYRAHLGQEVSPELALALGDFAHNLRSSLDHLVACIAPTGRKRQTKFIVLRDDIWETDPETGEYIKGFVTNRLSWDTAVDGMPDDAIAFLKLDQPYQRGERGENHGLALLNALDNADKHYEITTVSLGIKDPVITLTWGRGQPDGFRVTIEGEGTVEDGGLVGTFVARPHDLKAQGFPEDLREHILGVMADGEADVDVEITGTPQIAFQVPELEGHLPIPETLHTLATSIRRSLIEPMERWVRPDV